MAVPAAAESEDKSTTEWPARPLLLTAEQAASALAICRTKVYELLRSGELESVQIGQAGGSPPSP